MIQIVAALIGLILLGAGGFLVHSKGYKEGHTQRDKDCRIQIADIESEKAEAQRQAQAEREKGRIVADDLATKLHTLNARLVASEKRVQDEISKRASAVRAALDGQLVRVLNEQSTIRETISGSDSSVTTGSRNDETIPAPAPDRDRPSGGASSERAIATWISNAITLYNSCRETVHAWQDWARSVAK